MSMNYNQFYYFWIIAKEMSVTRAAMRLRLSQSNLSAQLKTFEDTIGQPLFERKKRSLHLTESGKVAFEYANTIFKSGEELIHVFSNKTTSAFQKLIRVGSVNNLSKNLQFEFIKPLLKDEKLRFYMAEDSQNEMVRMLQNHELDVVVTTHPVRGELSPQVFNHRLGEIDVYLVGIKKYKNAFKKFPECLSEIPLILPVKGSHVRSEFDSWCSRIGIQPLIRAEIDDMALMRIFAIEGTGVALVPEIVVRRELDSQQLFSLKKMTGIQESFYALTSTRKFPNMEIQSLVRDFLAKQNRQW